MKAPEEMFRDPAGFDPAGSLHHPDGSLHDTPRGPSRDPASACEDLRPDLFLYAEGELDDPSSLLRVRRHLRDCPSCEERLARHDALTRALLAGVLEDAPPVAGDDSRADRIMHLIRRLPALSLERRALRLEAPAMRTRTPAWPRALASAAAFLVVGIAFLIFAGTHRGSLEDRLASPGEPASAGRTVELREAALVKDRPLWVTIPRVPQTMPRDFPVQLLGFHPDLRRSPDDGVVLEWMVDALIAARPSSGKRFFLVPEASDFAAVEITPVAWLDRPRILLHSRETDRRDRAYRVYVVDAPGLLGGVLPEAALSPARLVPRLVEGAAGLSHDPAGLSHPPAPEWVLPAVWKN